jgi:hypothetical protein
VPVVVLTTVAAAAVVVVGFLRLCPRRFVESLTPVEITAESPDSLCAAGFTDGTAVVTLSAGVTGVTVLTLDAIHAK